MIKYIDHLFKTAHRNNSLIVIEFNVVTSNDAILQNLCRPHKVYQTFPINHISSIKKFPNKQEIYSPIGRRWLVCQLVTHWQFKDVSIVRPFDAATDWFGIDMMSPSPWPTIESVCSSDWEANNESTYSMWWWARFRCVFRLPFWVKAIVQKVHLYGFSPLCFFIWICSAFFWLKAFLQSSHTNGRSPTIE